MKPARSPFVVFFLERSGSSHLCSLLDSHPQISCGAEEFTTRRATDTSAHEAPRYIHSRDAKILAPDEEETQNHLANIFARSEHAAGFKMKYPIQFQRYPEILESLKAINDSLRVIHLDRANVVKKFVSKQVLVQQRTATAGFRRTEKIAFEPIRIELNGMLDTLRRFMRQREELKTLASSFQHRLAVEYERFNIDEPALVVKLLEFLGVEGNRSLESKFQKKTPPTLEKSVINFDELVDALTDTEFESMV